MDQQLQQYLKEHHIQYTLHTHPAVFSVAEAEIHCKHVPGLPCKNLFLTDKEHPEKIYLVILPGHKRLDMKSLAKNIGIKALTFGSEQQLYETLKLTPGSVSPFGLIHDIDHKVNIIIDQEVWDAPKVNFHPNINTESLELTQDNFHRFISSLKHSVRVMQV